jgi:hypothetical protein
LWLGHVRGWQVLPVNNHSKKIAFAKKTSGPKTASTISPGREEKAAWTKQKVENCLNRTDFIDINKEVLNDIIAQGNMKFVDAGFKIQCEFNNVLIRIPPIIDNCLKKIAGHYCAFPGNYELNGPLNVIFIPEHYCRTFFPIKGISVFRHFFTEVAMLGTTVVADLKIQIKTNYKDDSQAVVINYQNIRPKEEAKAEYTEKLNAPTGQVKISGTDRFVAIEPIRKKTS